MSHIVSDGIYGESYMTANYYKPFFEKIQTYIPKSVHPNVLTIGNFILVIYLYNSKLYYNSYIFAFFQLIFFVLDFLDGIHARKTKQTSKLGEILDHGLDPLRGILVIKMFFDILKINDNSILFLFSLCFNLFLLTAKYSNKYLYGTKYISIDDFGILQIIATLFINKIDPTIIKNNINLVKYVIGFLILVQLSYLYKFKITKTDIFIFLLVNYISYLNTNNLTNLLLINFIYPVYTIL